MPPSVALMLALLAAMHTHEVDGSLADLICANPDHWNENAPFEPEGQATTCGQVTQMYLTPYQDKSSLTTQECNTVLDVNNSRTMKFGLFYLGHSCCGTGEAAFPCGWPFNVNPCAETEDFLNKPFGQERHCSGDERIQDKTTCVNAGGEEAWDDSADEKCDVGRTDLNETQRASACQKLGGTYRQNMCHDLVASLETIDPTSSCDSKTNFNGLSKAVAIAYAADTCCERPSTQCGEINTNPCKNAEDFMPSDTYDDEGNKCSMLGSYMASIVGKTDFGKLTQDDCANRPAEFGGFTTVEMVLDVFGAKCCGGKPSNGFCSATRTCGDVKKMYKENGCCGNPSTPFVGGRRLQAFETDDHDGLLAEVRQALNDAYATGGVANAKTLEHKLRNEIGTI